MCYCLSSWYQRKMLQGFISFFKTLKGHFTCILLPAQVNGRRGSICFAYLITELVYKNNFECDNSHVFSHPPPLVHQNTSKFPPVFPLEEQCTTLSKKPLVPVERTVGN